MTNTTSTPAKIEQRAPRNSGFTLVEILVAVSIMALLLTVILVPLRLGFNSFHIGKARAEVQQQAQVTLQQIAIDLRRAKFVFPNSAIDGVSNNANAPGPCSPAAYRSESAWGFKPYVISNGTGDTNGADTNTGTGVAWENLSRIDMLMTRSNSSVGLDSSVGEDYIVTYYARRADPTKPYDVVDNPMVLYRAQYPYRAYNTTSKTFAPVKSQTVWPQYPASPASMAKDPQYLWVAHNYLGEANLAPLCVDGPTGAGIVPVAGAHTPVIPTNMGLVTPRGNTGTAGSLVPELSFVEEATDGRNIDRVTINMNLAQYDQAGAGQSNGQAAAQRVRVSQTIDLPNVACSVN